VSPRPGLDPHRPAPHGILLVDKAPDRTSHDVVARVRWLLGTKKVGHAGTLDPMATGLLVLGIGQGTRLLTHLVGLDKVYTARIRLGQGTTTDDREGEPVGEVVDATGLDDPAIASAIAALTGDISQVPSTVSAIKVDGKRAYARARAGEDVELAARPVHVDRFDLHTRRDRAPFVDLDVEVACGSGTYVRALARDLGAALGVGGHLTALRRTHVGPFDVTDAVHVPARGEGDDVELPLRGLGEVAAQVLPVCRVGAQEATALGQGRRIRRRPEDPLPERSAALDEDGRLVAVLEPREGDLRPVLVIPAEARC
jgi:tRNA pseudouridine55 synthase